MAGGLSEQTRCERCGKPTSRLIGAGAMVQMVEPDRVRVEVAALGYCLEHKNEVVPAWLAGLRLDGEADLVSDDLVDLRPRDAAAFVTTMQAELGMSMQAELDPGSKGTFSLSPDDGVPENCPHCGGRLLWGEGPHAGDKRVLAKTAFAWECEGCRAAGLLTLT